MMNEWISVEDELPLKEKGRRVVFLNSSIDGMGLARFHRHTYSQHDWAWIYKQVNGTHYINNGDVTHWMSRPDPPVLDDGYDKAIDELQESRIS
jgi:hypothetical protein